MNTRRILPSVPSYVQILYNGGRPIKSGIHGFQGMAFDLLPTPLMSAKCE